MSVKTIDTAFKGNAEPAFKEVRLKEIVTDNCLGGNYQCVDDVTSLPVIKMGNLGRGTITLGKIEYVSDGKILSDRDVLKKGDILFNTRNTLDLVGKVAMWRGELEHSVFNSNIMRITFSANVLNDYMNYYFNSYSALKQLRARATGTTSVAAIYWRDCQNIKIPLPPLPEQKAIAALLSTWDEAIEKTERLIVKKQKFYEAQLSKRLSSDVSERIKLKKFLKEVSKRNSDLSINQVLSVTNSKGFVRPEDQFDRQVASDNLSNYKIVSKGEYAYNPSRINVGSIARLDDWDFGVLSPMYTVFEIKKPSELHTDLFLHWLNSHEAKQRIKLSAQGSVRETVSFDDFCAIGFPKIDFNEQKALAEYFSLISVEIDTLKALSDKYNTQKRGLMQKMLTGEWRVKPEIVNQYMEA